MISLLGSGTQLEAVLFRIETENVGSPHLFVQTVISLEIGLQSIQIHRPRVRRLRLFLRREPHSDLTSDVVGDFCSKEVLFWVCPRRSQSLH